MRIYTDRSCLRHEAPPGYPEKPERLSRILDHLASREQDPWPMVNDAAPHLDLVGAAVRSVHGEEYVDRFRKAVERGDGLLDSADNPLCAETWVAARGAVAASLAAADWIVAGQGGQAFAAVRPPGHHAESEAAMGFCFFCNIAVAAQYLLDRHGLERVAILDFDVHHGNGTQHIFEERGDVLFISLHQHPFYPGTGAAAENGLGEGRGATLNLPLPAGCGDEDYEGPLGEAIAALEAFAPDALLISAGFDAWREDPLGSMGVSEEGYRDWGRRLGHAAARICQGRVLSLLEGGYDLEALPRLVEVYLEGLSKGVSGGSE